MNQNAHVLRRFKVIGEFKSKFYPHKRNIMDGGPSGQMAQWLRANIALVENSLIQSPANTLGSSKLLVALAPGSPTCLPSLDTCTNVYICHTHA